MQVGGLRSGKILVFGKPRVLHSEIRQCLATMATLSVARAQRCCVFTFEPLTLLLLRASMCPHMMQLPVLILGS